MAHITRLHSHFFKRFSLKTRISVRLSDDANGKIKKSNLEVIDLLKKLNIRSLINFYDSPIDSYDELDNGLYAESLTEYGCWCLPQDGFHIDCCYLTFSNRDQPQSINKKTHVSKICQELATQWMSLTKLAMNFKHA